MDPLISVVVPNWNGMEHLPDCFRSLAAADYPAARQEWILSDNGSEDGSREFIRREYPQTRIVDNGGNIGFAPGCNAGARAARGQYVVFLNNDTRVDPGWLRGYLAALTRAPDAVCAASYMRSWDGTEPDFNGCTCNLFGVGRQRPAAGWPDCPGGPQEGDPLLFACGGAMLIDRQVFLDVGGFDASYFIYFEDVDLGWRLWVLGHRVVYAPGSIVYHKEGGTTGARRVAGHRRYLLFETNTLATIYKNYEQANLDRVLPAALLLEWRRARLAAGDSIDPEPFRLGGADGNPHPAADLPPMSAAHFLALGRFVEHLPHLRAERARIQGARRRPDSAILPLFGRPFQPQFAGPVYADSMRRISAALDLYPLVAASAPTRILLHAPATGPDAARAHDLAPLLGAEFILAPAAAGPAGLAASADLLVGVGAAIPEAAALAPDLPLAADVAAAGPDAVPAAVRLVLEDRAGLLICADAATGDAWRRALPALPTVVQPAAGLLAPALRHYCRYPLFYPRS